MNEGHFIIWRTDAKVALQKKVAALQKKKWQHFEKKVAAVQVSAPLFLTSQKDLKSGGRASKHSK